MLLVGGVFPREYTLDGWTGSVPGQEGGQDCGQCELRLLEQPQRPEQEVVGDADRASDQVLVAFEQPLAVREHGGEPLLAPELARGVGSLRVEVQVEDLLVDLSGDEAQGLDQGHAVALPAAALGDVQQARLRLGS